MIIKNGLVVDPALGLSEKMDLAIENVINEFTGIMEYREYFCKLV